MGRPGEKITRKTIMMQNKMKELDLKERSSKSLLANVLDMEDDFRTASIHRYPRYGAPTPPTLSSSSHGQSFGSRPTGFEDDSSSIPCLQVSQRHLLSAVATSDTCLKRLLNNKQQNKQQNEIIQIKFENVLKSTMHSNTKLKLVVQSYR